VLPLGGGHAVYAQPAHGAAPWLIDCGDRSSVEFTLKPFLQAQGMNRIGGLLLTCGNARQTGGGARLNELFTVHEILVPPVSFRSSTYRETLSNLEARSRVRHCATNGFVLAPWTVLHPRHSGHFAAAEDNAVATLGDFDRVRVVLASNLGRSGQNAVFSSHPELRADIVVSGLPEKGEPLASAWLEHLRPRLIIIADSESPSTHRASADLLKRLSRTGATVLSTRESGAVTIQIQNGVWRVQTARPLNAIARALETDDRDVRDE